MSEAKVQAGWIVIRLGQRGKAPQVIHASRTQAESEARRLVCRENAVFMVARVEQIMKPVMTVESTLYSLEEDTLR